MSSTQNFGLAAFTLDDQLWVAYDKRDLKGSKIEICSVGNKLYSNRKFLIETHEKLIGSLELDDVIYLATTSKIYLYTSNFELIEILDSNNDLPKQLKKIGKLRGRMH